MDLGNLRGKQLGKYQLLNLIGKGGMSAVYRAHQQNLNRDVAIKVMSPALATDPTYVQRFVMEAKTAASLEHNNIVPLYDYGNDGDISYIAMRLLTGGTLGERLQHRIDHKEALPSLKEFTELLNELTKALGYAHSRGIIHRDIKASNVMFDTQGDPYLVDFGISRAVRTNVALTADNVTIGTPTYMAPEQWRDETLTPAVDQYALGVLMYFVLTGRLPFYGSNAPALMQKHLNNTPTPPHELRPDLPEKASTVLLRALAKDPDERYVTVQAFGESLSATLQNISTKKTDFFTFILPDTIENTSHPQSPPSAASTVPNMPAAAATVPNMPALQTPSPEDMMANIGGKSFSPAAPTSPKPPAAVEAPIQYKPQSPPPPKQAPPQKPASATPKNALPGGWLGIAAVGVVGVIIIGLLFLTGILNPQTKVTPVSIDATSESGTGGIRINPSPGSINDIAPTAITLVAPGGGSAGPISVENPIRVSEQQTIHTELTIVVRTVDVSPFGVIASGHADGKIRMWTGGIGGVPVVLQQHTNVVNDLKISANGQVMVSGSDDQTVRVWDAINASYRGVLAGHTSAVRGVAVSPDGKLAASASEDGTVRLWNVDAGSQIATLQQSNVRVFTTAFSPDGQFIAAGDNEGVIRIWNSQTQILEKTLRGHSESVRSVAFSPDGTRLASSSTDDTVKVWDLSTNAVIHTLQGHGRDVWRVIFSPDGSIIASGGRDNNLRLWNTESGASLANLTGHGGWVLGVAFSPDGGTIVSGGGDGTVRMWQITN